MAIYVQPKNYGAHQFYIDGLLLPITPSDIKTRIDGNNEEIELANGQFYTAIKLPKLAVIEFGFILPISQANTPFAVYEEEFNPPAFYIAKLESLLIKKKPFPFVVIEYYGIRFKSINIKCTLDNYEVIQDAEKYGEDTYVSVKLSRYEEHRSKKVNLVVDNGQVKAEVKKDNKKKEIPKTHKVVYGDTLSKIALKYYGDSKKYKEIAKKNKLADPNKLSIGQVLQLV